MNRLKELRKSRNLTQTEIAKFIGISQNNYSNWENEKVKIDNITLKRLADYFGVSVDYILGREEQITNRPQEIAPPIKMEAIARGGEMWTAEISQENYMKFVMRNKDSAVTIIKNGIIAETIRIPEDKVNLIRKIALSLRDEE